MGIKAFIALFIARIALFFCIANEALETARIAAEAHETALRINFHNSPYYNILRSSIEHSNVVEAHAQTVQKMILTQDGNSWKQYHINVLAYSATTIELDKKILCIAWSAFLTNQSINEFYSDYHRIILSDVGSRAKFSESRAVFSASRRAEINAERDPNNILSAHFLGVKLLESTGNFVGISNLDILQLLGHFRDFALVT